MDHKQLRRRPTLRRALGNAGVALVSVTDAKPIRHPHTHDLIELVVVRRGRLHHTIDGVERITTAGQVDCIPPGISHRYQPIGGQVDLINVICDPHHRPQLPAELDDMADSLCGLSANRAAHVRLIASDHTDEVIERMVREQDTGQRAWACALRGSYQLLLLSLARCVAARRVSWLGPGKTADHHLLGLVRTAIDDHPQKRWSLTQIAQQLGLSPEQTCRRFNAAYGRSPMAYVQHQRLRLAQSLMQGGLGVAESATAAGFPSRVALHRACTHEHGCGPRQWLRSLA